MEAAKGIPYWLLWQELCRCELQCQLPAAGIQYLFSNTLTSKMATSPVPYSVPMLLSILSHLYYRKQCCGPMTFWCGSGSNSADPCLRIRIQEAQKHVDKVDPDPQHWSKGCTPTHNFCYKSYLGIDNRLQRGIFNISKQSFSFRPWYIHIT
jgi:hypothetical protein